MENKQQPKRDRKFFGTLFDIKSFNQEFQMKLRNKCQYYVYGLETCPSTGTKHWQWCAYTRLQMTESAARKFFNCHTEICIDLPAAIIYCKKENDFIEWGQAPCQGKRTDLDDVRHRAANNGILDVVDHCSYQQILVAEKWLQYNAPKRDRNTPLSLIWVYGPPRQGKSTYADDYALERGKHYRKMGGKWWCGYQSEPLVVFDDFDMTDYTEKQLTTWWDIFPVRVERKGSCIELFASNFIVTSLYSPTEVFGPPGTKFSDQFHGRITKVIHIPSRGQIIDVTPSV